MHWNLEIHSYFRRKDLLGFLSFGPDRHNLCVTVILVLQFIMAVNNGKIMGSNK